MKKIYLFTFIVLSFLTASGQCNFQVVHLDGQDSVNGIDVTVNSSGTVSSNTDYCESTQPYTIGLNDEGGSFTFQFSPSVSALSLNFSGLSDMEEIHIFVNGSHYPISEMGNSNGCDPLAVLTAEGNIAACDNCPVSGWSDTIIEGPISELTVQNVVISGSPNGSLFSLFICEADFSVISNTFQNINISPNPFSGVTTLETNRVMENATIKLFDLTGKIVRKIANLNGRSFQVYRKDLKAGIYFFQVIEGGNLLFSDKVIVK